MENPYVKGSGVSRNGGAALVDCHLAVDVKVILTPSCIFR
jgi:hypothetical protein